MQNAYYFVAGMFLLGTLSFGWGMRHIARPAEQRKHLIGEVGGVACLLGGILWGCVMMMVFDLVRVVS